MRVCSLCEIQTEGGSLLAYWIISAVALSRVADLLHPVHRVQLITRPSTYLTAVRDIPIHTEF